MTLQPQVMGQLDNFDDDEASIDEDENSDGGAVSIAGDDMGGRAFQMVRIPVCLYSTLEVFHSRASDYRHLYTGLGNLCFLMSPHARECNS